MNARTGPLTASEARSDLPTRRELERLAWLLDSSIPLPGGWRIGLDGLIGLIPGVGDALGALIGLYIVGRASRLGLPGSVLGRMLGNLALEALIGTIPVIGDLFDFAFKANQRNVALLGHYAVDKKRVVRQSRLAVAAAGVVLVLLVIGIAALAVALVRWLVGVI